MICRGDERAALMSEVVGKLREVRRAFAVCRGQYRRSEFFDQRSVKRDGGPTVLVEVGAGGELKSDGVKRIGGEHGIA